jgi:uncharacterized phosphosugar-binding protein
MATTDQPFRLYHENLAEIFARISETELPALKKAAHWVADVVERNGIIYTLGSGHSLLIATELYYRAGGLANFDVIHDKTFGRAERLPGYGKLLLESYPISSNDLLILVSHSGRNELTVEMALEAKARGIRTIAVTSVAHSMQVSPRTASGLRLCEVVDLVIDNCGQLGDTSVELASPRGVVHVAPTSTATGIFIANSIVALAVQNLIDRQIDPPVFTSMNVDNGREKNQELIRFLRERVRGL